MDPKFERSFPVLGKQTGGIARGYAPTSKSIGEIKNHPLPPFRQVSRRRRRLWDKNSRNRWIDTSCPKSQCTAPAQQRHGRVVGTKEKTRLRSSKVGWHGQLPFIGAQLLEKSKLRQATPDTSWYVMDWYLVKIECSTSSQRNANRCDSFVPGDVQCLLEPTTTKGPRVAGQLPRKFRSHWSSPRIWFPATDQSGSPLAR